MKDPTGISAILKGFGVTLKNFSRDATTISYPEKRKELYPRFKGLHRLERYEDGPFAGMERCIGCSLCAAACPADAIRVVARENDPDSPNSPGERYAEVYEIDMLRCIFCGDCEDACPTEAIVLYHEYELDGYERPKDFIYGKDKLLDRPLNPMEMKLKDRLKE